MFPFTASLAHPIWPPAVRAFPQTGQYCTDWFDSYRILFGPLALFISEGVYAELGEQTTTIIPPWSLLLLQ